jgi:hypothetical protein
MTTRPLPDNRAELDALIRAASPRARLNAARTLAAISKPRDFDAEEKGHVVIDMSTAHPDIEPDLVSLRELAALVLIEQALIDGSDEHRAQARAERARGDEALALHLLKEYGDADGFVALRSGGGPDFDARAYFRARLPVAKKLATDRAKKKKVQKTPLQVAKARLSDARGRIRRKEEALRRAEAGLTADPCSAAYLQAIRPGGPVDQAREALDVARAGLAKAEANVRAAETARLA